MKNLQFISVLINSFQVYRIILVFVVILSSSSCSDFVEVPLPNSQLTGTTVFESELTANAAMAQIYVQLRDGGILSGLPTGASVRMGLYADELQDYANSTISLPIYNNALTADNATVASLWTSSYSQIYNANSVIQGVENATGLPIAVKNRVAGEALFVRAVVHFYLLQIYGSIPYITGTNYEMNRKVTRSSADEVYAAIAKDLESASTRLPDNYSSSDRAKPNKMVAKAMLARVYLYMNKNTEAANEATAVINSPLYAWETDLNKIFLRNGRTTIWQLASATAVRNTNEGATFIFASGPPPVCALRTDFMNAFETGDQRKVNWTKAVTTGINMWYHPNKYKLRTATTSSQEYSIVLRLAEQYLIRAEARAKQGDLAGAKEDLNKIRTTAGLPIITSTIATEILSEIQKQRRFEFFTEHGHRFFDLKRSGTADGILSVSKPGWNSSDIVWPIPELELNANPNLLPQNAGY